MFCSKCGNALPDDAMFCGNCGHSFDEVPNEPAKANGASITGGRKAPAAKHTLAGIRVDTRALIIIGIVVVLVGFPMLLIACSGSGNTSNDSGANVSPYSSYSSSAVSSDYVDDDGDAADSTPTNINELNEMLNQQASSQFVGTWRDPQYGDTMTLESDGSCTISQSGVGVTNWTWSESSSGIRIENSANSYTLSYGFVDGHEALYNNSKGLLFQR